MRGVCPANLAACALILAVLVAVCANAPPVGAQTAPGVEIVNVATSTFLAEEGGLDPPVVHEVESTR